MVDMKKMMKQAQKMQREALKAQDEIAEMEFTGTAGGGMVKATVTGDQTLTSLSIDPEAVDPEDVEMLEDLVMAAVNEALRTAADSANQRMSALMGGMNLGGMNLPGIG